MRISRAMREMAGLVPTAHDKALKRYETRVERLNRRMLSEVQLIEAITRRQRGEEGTTPMPFAKMRADLEKMKGG
jgi:hypothetical protein